jgi:nucleoside-triphosphatase
MTNILLTGKPGCGKTTVAIATARNLHDLSVSGFYTEEIRDGSKRVGFRIVTFGSTLHHSETDRILAHIDFSEGPRVLKYRVDLPVFDEVAVPSLSLERQADVFVVDEIGKMECFSERFQRAIERLLNSRRPLLATVARKGRGLIAESKRRPDAELVEVTLDNREALPQRLAGRLCELAGR